MIAGPPEGAVAVIFSSGLSDRDPDGYARAATQMVDAASMRDGYMGIMSTRAADGVGVTISWWRDEDAARGWRDDPDHTLIREKGRALWYDWYHIAVVRVDRSYGWERAADV